MNSIYRSIWSEITKEQDKRSTHRRKLLATGLLICSTPVWALPTGNQLIAGQAAVSNPAANLMQINQASQKAIINWQGFSIAPNETVNIQQPNANAALLNRVVGQDASQIQGQLHANGQVYLVNPNGVVFGQNAQVDVGGLIATTHNISNADFMNGKNHFTQNGAIGKVENHGTINTKDGGVVALIGESVTNTGSINTPKGTTVLAAGKTVDLDFQGNGLVEVKVSKSALNEQITNKGAIQADSGRVVLTAKAANSLIDTVINQQGIIRAQGLSQRNGEIMLEGGTINQTGSLDASGKTGGTIHLQAANNLYNSGNINATGEQGGTIDLVANNNVTLTAANVDASGSNKGGLIRVGGDFHGANTKIPNAKTTRIDNATTLKADGGTGKVVVWSNAQTDYYGSISANKAGNIEVSSKGLLNYAGHANAGVGGNLLLDPKNIIIQNAFQLFPLGTGVPFSTNIGGTTFVGIQNATDTGLTSTLINGTNVTLQANNDITLNAGADIIVTPFSVPAGNLTLQAGRNITLNASIKTANANFTAIAGDPNAIASDRSSGTPTLTLNSGATINAGTGKVILAAIGGNFVNNSGSSSPITARQWWIYSTNPEQNTRNGISDNNKHYAQPYTGVTPSYATTGNWLLYSITPTLTVTPNSQTITVGTTPAGFIPNSYTGFIDGDTSSTAGISGTAVFGIDNFTGAAGLYNVAYLKGLASSLGYRFADNTGSINELKVEPVTSIVLTTRDGAIDNNPLLPQVTPLQQSTIFVFRDRKEPNPDADLIDTENDGMKLPAKLHTIISLAIPCSIGTGSH